MIFPRMCTTNRRCVRPLFHECHGRRRRLLSSHSHHKKLFDTAEQALSNLGCNFLRGATIAVGGFGPCGVPETLLHALEQNDMATDLTIVALDVGTDHRGVGKLIQAGTSVVCRNTSAETTNKHRKKLLVPEMGARRYFLTTKCKTHRKGSSHDCRLCRGKQGISRLVL